MYTLQVYNIVFAAHYSMHSKHNNINYNVNNRKILSEKATLAPRRDLPSASDAIRPSIIINKLSDATYKLYKTLITYTRYV